MMPGSLSPTQPLTTPPVNQLLYHGWKSSRDPKWCDAAEINKVQNVFLIPPGSDSALLFLEGH